MADVLARAGTMLADVRHTIAAVDSDAVAKLLAAIDAASAVYFDGRGRSGLVARALAMRWMHLGLRVHVVGETVTPAIGPDDLLVCLSGSGRTSGTLASAGIAGAQGALVGVMTGDPESPLAAAADLLVVVPRIESDQHPGSLFDQACLVLGDAVCGTFQHAAAIPRTALDQRHANLL